MPQKLNYPVVFEYTKGSYKGVRFWRSFTNKEDLEEWLKDAPKNEKIIAQGVTEEMAINLCANTSVAARAASCIAEATDGEGNVHRDTLQLQMTNIAVASKHIGRDITEELLVNVELLLLAAGKRMV